jgi:ABC-type multidrug transport system fused ATPase/permease subunit
VWLGDELCASSLAAFACGRCQSAPEVGLDAQALATVFLIDYLDHLLHGKGISVLANVVEWLPGAATPPNLIGWSVGATILIFLLSWVIGLLAAYANISLGQRMTYDLAGDVFAKLQQLSLHFHARKSVGDNIRRVTGDCACASIIVKDALLRSSSIVSLAAMFCILWRIDAALALLSLAVALT